LRVLHVIGSLDMRYGGPIRAALDLSTVGEKHGVIREFLCVGDARAKNSFRNEGFIHCIVKTTPGGYGYTPLVRKWLDENVERFDGVILHGIWEHVLLVTARACNRHGVPYSIFPHGMLEPWSIERQGRWKHLKKSIYWQIAARKTFEQASNILFTTGREMQQAKLVFQFEWPRTVVAPYGVPVPTTAEDDSSGMVPELEGKKFLLFLGRVHPHKHIPLLVEAWARSLKDSDWKLVIAGPSAGDHRAQVEDLVKKLGVADQCMFIDFVSGMQKEWLFRHAQWFALPSEHENFGIAAAEALVRGCPVILSDQVYSGEKLEPLGRILPLTEDAWVEFFANHLRDARYRDTVIESDRKMQQSFRLSNIGVEWANLVRSMFPERVRQ